MQKRLILLAVIIIILSFLVNAENLTGGSCERDSICILNCTEGDSDCKCASQNGFVCSAMQICNATLLKNWDEVVCCSAQCINSTLIENKDSIKPLELMQQEKKETQIGSKKTASEFEKVSENKTFQYSLLLAFVIILSVAVLVSFLMRHLSDEVGFVAGRADRILSSLKNLFKKEKPKKKQMEKTKGVKINPLIEGILDTLQSDEQKAFKAILENEGIKRDSLKDMLGYENIKMNQTLLKLERKQLIKKKDEPNPKIYVHEWLK